MDKPSSSVDVAAKFQSMHEMQDLLATSLRDILKEFRGPVDLKLMAVIDNAESVLAQYDHQNIQGSAEGGGLLVSDLYVIPFTSKVCRWVLDESSGKVLFAQERDDTSLWRDLSQGEILMLEESLTERNRKRYSYSSSRMPDWVSIAKDGENQIERARV